MRPYTTAELAAIVQRAEALVPVNDSAAFSLICQFRTDVPRLAAEVIALRKALRDINMAVDAMWNDETRDYNMPIHMKLISESQQRSAALLPPEPS